MKLVIDYVDEAKEKSGIKSDAAFGQSIGGTVAMIGNWRNRGSTPEDYYCIRIAEILRIDPLEVIAAANWEREKNQEKKDWWESFRKAHAGKVAGAVLIGVIALPSPPAKAEYIGTTTYNVEALCNADADLNAV